VAVEVGGLSGRDRLQGQARFRPSFDPIGKPEDGVVSVFQDAAGGAPRYPAVAPAEEHERGLRITLRGLREPAGDVVVRGAAGTRDDGSAHSQKNLARDDALWAVSALFISVLFFLGLAAYLYRQETGKFRFCVGQK
jgi:hypothetical protein